MKSFEVPEHYRSPLVSAVKERRKLTDKLKKDVSPSVLQIGSLRVILARHFGFCYGVENAIEIAFGAIRENVGKRVFLLSEMIHNPGVNADLEALGVQFIMDTSGRMLMDWDDISAEDVVIIPAFGTTLELESLLSAKGIDPARYETTCPFVEKVWNRAGKIGDDGYTIVVHGKPGHEETRATFSHSSAHTPTVIVRDMQQARLLAEYIYGSRGATEFYEDFRGQYSEGFDPEVDLERIGVVNQTTMLATETQAIADYLKKVVLTRYPNREEAASNFADTRDTLCYATNDNQSAVIAMLEQEADFALVIGGYNSSNTSHLVELCEHKLATYFIANAACLHDNGDITCYNVATMKEEKRSGVIHKMNANHVMITSGASCPDALVERVIERLASITGNETFLGTMDVLNK